MADAATAASNAGTATAALLGPTSAGSQVALVLYGLYLALHVRHVSSEAFGRLVLRVKATLWLVFVLLTAYTVLLFVDSTYWTSAFCPSSPVSSSSTNLSFLQPLPNERLPKSATAGPSMRFFLFWRRVSRYRCRRC